MALTNNGWSKDPLVTRIYVGGDADGAEVAVGDVALIFDRFLRRFHAEVEPIYQVNGYRTSAFNASLKGSAANSNHVSGTAVDVNGSKHPNEAVSGRILSSGFTATQLARLRRLLADFPVIIWGGDTSAKFSLRKRDYMHFEIHGTVAQVAAFANAIRESERPKPPTKPPVTPPPAGPATSEDDDMIELIRTLYRAYLDRDPSPYDELNWSDAFTARGLNAQQAHVAFRTSHAEVGTVRAAYRLFLGREAGPSEQAEWSDTETIDQVWNGVSNSQEARNRR